MTAILFALLKNKYVLSAIATLALLLGLTAGIRSIESAYSQRDQFKQQLAVQQAETTKAQAARDAAIRAANDAAQLAAQQRAEQDRIDKESAARAASIDKELEHANQSLAVWRHTADTLMSQCLARHLPIGLLPTTATGLPGAAGGDDQAAPASEVPH